MASAMRCSRRLRLVARRPRGPTLFRQIAVRLAVFTLLFALLDVGIVVTTYVAQPQSLAQELLTLEASRIEAAPEAARQHITGPPGARHWLARFLDQQPLAFTGSAMPSTRLVDWTQREKVADGYRITGVRSVTLGGRQRWLLMQFEANSLEPYLPVIRNEILQHVALPLIPLSLFLLVFNVVAVRRMLGPLRKAEREVDGLDPENMVVRLSEPAAPREVNTLVRAMNRALDRLDSAMDTLRTFTTHAAHELRTPLSILELSLAQLPPGQQREDLLNDAGQMTRLVGQMLDLAQADALSVDAGNLVDLAAVGRDVVAALTPMAYQAKREIRFEDCGPAWVQGHSEAIYRIYRNLIENALAHAPGETPIVVTAGPGPQFSVRDHGPGIAPDDLANIFERFWRKDRQRAGGAGLGLGIVQRLVEAHGGGISVAPANGGGTIFHVTFVGSGAERAVTPTVEAIQRGASRISQNGL